MGIVVEVFPYHIGYICRDRINYFPNRTDNRGDPSTLLSRALEIVREAICDFVQIGR